MKVVVTSTAPELDAQMDPRFGRAQYLLLVDTDSMEFEAMENPNIALGGGAGIQTAQMIANQGVEAVLTGNCGPNAYRTLSAASITVYVGFSGTVRQAVESLKRGELQPVDGPSVQSHFGAGMGPGRGMGRGMGPGRGMGRGMGRGQGMRMQAEPPTPAAGTPSREEQLRELKQMADGLKQQLDEINRKVKELEEE